MHAWRLTWGRKSRRSPGRRGTRSRTRPRTPSRSSCSRSEGRKTMQHAWLGRVAGAVERGRAAAACWAQPRVGACRPARRQEGWAARHARPGQRASARRAESIVCVEEVCTHHGLAVLAGDALGLRQRVRCDRERPLGALHDGGRVGQVEYGAHHGCGCKWCGVGGSGAAGRCERGQGPRPAASLEVGLTAHAHPQLRACAWRAEPLTYASVSATQGRQKHHGQSHEQEGTRHGDEGVLVWARGEL